jgi:hypothetical protein
MLNLLRSFAGVTVFSVACASLGYSFIRTFRIDESINPTTSLAQSALLVTAFLVGHGVFSLIFLALGGLYQLTSIHVALILLIGLMAGFRHIKKILQTIFSRDSFQFTNKPDNKNNGLILWLSRHFTL